MRSIVSGSGGNEWAPPLYNETEGRSSLSRGEGRSLAVKGRQPLLKDSYFRGRKKARVLDRKRGWGRGSKSDTCLELGVLRVKGVRR